MARPAGRIRNTKYAIFCDLVAVLFIVVTILGMVDPAMDANREANARWAWVPWVFLAGSGWLATRAWFIGASVVDNAVVKHGWFRTRQIPVADVRRISTGGYDGAWSRGESRALRLVVLELQSGDTVRLYELVGRRRTAEGFAEDLSVACGIPVPPRSSVGGRHRV